MPRFDAHMLLTLQIQGMNLPRPVHEHRFHDRRRYRLDMAWPEMEPPIGVEVHGAVWKSGRHTRGAGFTEDRRKMNLAVECGWRIFEFTSDMVTSGEAVRQLKRVLCGQTSSGETSSAA
jgi:hypothetical protein